MDMTFDLEFDGADFSGVDLDLSDLDSGTTLSQKFSIISDFPTIDDEEDYAEYQEYRRTVELREEFGGMHDDTASSSYSPSPEIRLSLLESQIALYRVDSFEL